MAVNNEFATEVERLYKGEEVALHQLESQAKQIKELQHKVSTQSQDVTNNVQQEKSSLELQIQQLKLCLENVKSEKQKLETTFSSREEVS